MGTSVLTLWGWCEKSETLANAQRHYPMPSGILGIRQILVAMAVFATVDVESPSQDHPGDKTTVWV